MRKYNNASGYHHLYDSGRWRKMRKAQLAAKPLCEFCEAQGITEQATIADHMKPHKGDEELFFDEANLQSLCKTCHDKYKRIQEQSGVLVGCDKSGIPIDKNSHWHK
jgi:5-methylcytosine-specific restriction protein A